MLAVVDDFDMAMAEKISSAGDSTGGAAADAGRAGVYRMLAALLSAPPTGALLESLRHAEPEDDTGTDNNATVTDADNNTGTVTNNNTVADDNTGTATDNATVADDNTGTATDNATGTANNGTVTDADDTVTVTGTVAGADTVTDNATGTGTDFPSCWRQLVAAARDASAEALEDEYHDLFIGLGRGEVVPFASWHLTGFLMERPLSDLRDDLKALGLTADAAQKDPEDHIAALCESMALIIRAEDVDAAREQAFFARHLQPWAAKFFAELQSAKAARFYRAVGKLGQRFVDIEAQSVNFSPN